MGAEEVVALDHKPIQQSDADLHSFSLVEQVSNGYGPTKRSYEYVGFVADAVKRSIQNAGTTAATVYAHYCQPQVNNVVSAYSKGVEGTKYALDVTRNFAVTTSTFGIGATLLCAQLGLSLGTAGANFLLDCAITTKRVGTNLFTSAKVYEEAVEKHLIHYVHQAHGAIQEPMKDLVVQANGFLDMANAAVNNLFGLVPEPEPAECFLGERAMHLLIRFYSALMNRAHGDIIDPLYLQLHTFADELNKAVLLADLIRERQVWVIEKVDEWHASINDLKERIEKEAAALKLSPEELLMNSVRHTSAQLSGKLVALREKGSQVLGESALATLEATVAYLNKMEMQFGDAANVYQLRDEVLCEAQSKLSELMQWTSKWLEIGEEAWEFEGHSPSPYERAVVFVVPARLPSIAGGA